MGMLKRKRGLIVKLVLGIPVLWFSLVGFTVVLSGGGMGGLPGSDNPNPRFNRESKDQQVPQPEQQVQVNPIQDTDLGGADDDPLERVKDHRDSAGFKAAMHKHHAESLRQRGDEVHNHPHMVEEGEKNNQVMEPHLKKKTTTVDPKAPGELGKAVVIEKDKLTAEERKIFDEGWQKNAFNQYASDMISLHRSLPDVRDAECKSIRYHDMLPDTSVIVIFHNEAWSVLLRTVFSVIDRSPPHLLKEVIMVDDFSDFDHLQQPLQDFADKTDKVRLVRNPKREGLIRARLHGAAVATGDVLTFLDSHCECAQGWLEPMLDRIKENRSNVVTPVIDVLDDETLRYQYGSAKGTSVGGFDWNLQFNWHAIPDHEKKRRASDVAPVRSPTMAGGLFAISREYFEYLGAYDPGMDIWGGENLELSFRTWMCGGTLEIIPCSHVGHIFRKRSPYSWKTGVNVVKKNSIRLAEVWMDDYKKYYYERFNYDLGDYGDVSARKQLRERLKCKSFDWFIQNIYPDLFIPGDAVASGEIRNKYKSMCLDSSVDHHSMNKPVKMWPCHNQGGNQFWMLSAAGEIRRDEGCMDYAGQFLMIYGCHSMKGNQEWILGVDNTIRHKNTGLCIEISEDGNKPEMKQCTGTDRQIWQWKRKDPNLHGALPQGAAR